MHVYAKAMDMQEFIHGVRVRVFRWNEKLPEKPISESEGILMFRVHDKVEVLKDPTCDQILGAGYGTKGVIHPPANTILAFQAFCHKSCTKERFLRAISFVNLFHPNNHKLLAKLVTEYFLSCFSFDTLTVLDPSSPKLVVVMEVCRKLVLYTNTSLEEIPQVPNLYESHPREERIKETYSVGIKQREEKTRPLDQSSDEEEIAEDNYSNMELCDILGILRYYLRLSPIRQHPREISKKEVRGLSEVKAAVNILSIVDGKIQDQCAICLEGFYRGGYRQIAKLPCSHIFHKHCAFKWLPYHDSCPICRSVCTTSI